MIQKLRLYIEFYKSVAFINVGLAVICLLFAPSQILLSLTLFALPIIYFYKKWFREREYYFYYNNHISKVELFIFCLAFNILCSIIILIIYGVFFGSR